MWSYFNFNRFIPKYKHLFKYSVAILIGMLALGAIGSYWTNFINALRLIIAGIFIFFIPGWCITMLLYPYSEKIIGDDISKGSQKSLDYIERITLAIIISILLSSAIVFALNGISVDKLTPSNLAIAIVFMNITLCALVAWRKHWITLMYAIPLAMFPAVSATLDFAGFEFTTRNMALEVAGLIFIIVVLWRVTKTGGIRLN